MNTTTSPVIERIKQNNPAPGICLPVIVSFCQHHKIPYNYTVFPNYMGQFGQRDAQQELEVYDAVVNVRCYELAALFLCSLFVPKCGPGGVLVRPCRNLCFGKLIIQTRRIVFQDFAIVVNAKKLVETAKFSRQKKYYQNYCNL